MTSTPQTGLRSLPTTGGDPHAPPDAATPDAPCDGCALAARTQVSYFCSGLAPPAHLAPERGYEYPLQAQSKCHPSCQGRVILDMPPAAFEAGGGPEGVLKWCWDVCTALDCDPCPTLKALLSNTLPPNVLVSPSASHPGYMHVIAFLVDARGRHVVPIDISGVAVGPAERRGELRNLACVRAAPPAVRSA